MVPSGPPTPVGGAQSVPPSLLRTNSGVLGAQGGSIPSQSAFPSLISPRSQYNSMNMLGNLTNVSALLSQSFGNVGSNSGLTGSGGLQNGGMDMGAESDPLSGIGNGMNFTPSPASFTPSNASNQVLSVQNQGQHFPNTSGNQMGVDQQQPQQLEAQSFQHSQQLLQQFSVHHGQQLQQQQQQQFQSLQGGLGRLRTAKSEPEMSNDQNGQHQQQHLHSLRNLAPVKSEIQQLQSLRNPVPVKMEPQQEQSLFLQQQQQQQQQQRLHLSRQGSQAAAAAVQMNMLQHQRLLHLQQQQQQQQIFKSLPQQRAQLQQQFQQLNVPVRSALKPSAYEPGTCARRLTHYMHHQQRRPSVSFLLLTGNLLSGDGRASVSSFSCFLC